MINNSQVLNFFTDKTSYHKNEILKIKKIKKGLTNESYLIKTNDSQKYLVRFSRNDFLNRQNEKQIYLSLGLDLIYFAPNGDLIRKWLNGKHFHIWNKNKIDLFVNDLKRIHQLKINNLEEFNPYIFFDKLDKQKDYLIIDEYTKLVTIHQNDPKIACHSDLNPNNILYSKKDKKIYIIDYEWMKLNNIYWELANFSREKLTKQQMVYLLNKYGLNDFKTFHDYLVITCLYAYQWSLSVPQSKAIKSYQKHIFKRLAYIRKITF